MNNENQRNTFQFAFLVFSFAEIALVSCYLFGAIFFSDVFEQTFGLHPNTIIFAASLLFPVSTIVLSCLFQRQDKMSYLWTIFACSASGFIYWLGVVIFHVTSGNGICLIISAPSMVFYLVKAVYLLVSLCVKKKAENVCNDPTLQEKAKASGGFAKAFLIIESIFTGLFAAIVDFFLIAGLLSSDPDNAFYLAITVIFGMIYMWIPLLLIALFLLLFNWQLDRWNSFSENKKPARKAYCLGLAIIGIEIFSIPLSVAFSSISYNASIEQSASSDNSSISSSKDSQSLETLIFDENNEKQDFSFFFSPAQDNTPDTSGQF